MYHAIVRQRLANAFAGLSQGRVEAITNELAPHAVHTFIGHHALSGVRRQPALIRQWYERLLRLMPGITFQLDEIVAKGPPWNTLAVVHWQETNFGTDGVQTTTDGVNVIKLRWGKVVSVRIYTDTVALKATLDRIFNKGTTEAHAAPIEG
ncbi:MAG: nuclear transport factor 2 family protein [Brachymonas sp.]|nr:nuclear transport factor 2 family protein [Brachymonas sp.]